MADPGYVGFDVNYLIGPQWYLAGAWVPSRPVKSDPSPGVIPLPTHGGTHIVQRRWRGSNRPAKYDALVWSFMVRADDEAAWYALKRAVALAAPFYFATGMRRTDAFPAVAGRSYPLTRPLAASVVPGITEITHPTVVTGGSGSASGQLFTASSTGLLTVDYTPVHLVVATQFPEEIPQENQLDAQIELTEILIVP